MILCGDIFLCFAGCGCYLGMMAYLIYSKRTDYLHEAIKKKKMPDLQNMFCLTAIVTCTPTRAASLLPLPNPHR